MFFKTDQNISKLTLKNWIWIKNTFWTHFVKKTVNDKVLSFHTIVKKGVFGTFE